MRYIGAIFTEDNTNEVYNNDLESEKFIEDKTFDKVS